MAFVAGMALFWPFFSFIPYPGMLCPGPLGPLLGGDDLASSALYVVGFVAAAAMGTAGPHLSHTSSDRLLRRWVAGTFAAVAVLIVAVPLLPPGTIRAAACHGTALVGACNAGLLALGWARAAEAAKPDRLDTPLALGLFASFALRHGAGAPCGAAGLEARPVLSALPPLSCVAWLALSSKTPRKTARDGRPNAAAPPVPQTGPARWPNPRDPYTLMALALGIYLAASYFFGNAYGSGGHVAVGPFSQAFAPGLSLAVAGVAAPSERSGGYALYVWVLFVALGMIASYFAATFGPSAPEPAQAVILPTRAVALFFVWLAALAYTRGSGMGFVRATGLLFLPAVAVEFGMAAVGQLMSASGTQIAVTPGLTFAFGAPAVLLLAAALLGMAQHQARVAAEPAGPAARPALSRAEACARVAERSRLTAREQEALGLPSQGNSLKKVAELLGIAPSSAQTYSKSVYHKTGWHALQEVIDAVAREMEARQP